MKALRKKFGSSSGETLVETLFALLIVVLAMTVLAGSIVAAAKVNQRGEQMETEFQKSETDLREDGTVHIAYKEASGIESSDIDVKVYTTNDDNAYKYYEKASE